MNPIDPTGIFRSGIAGMEARSQVPVANVMGYPIAYAIPTTTPITGNIWGQQVPMQISIQGQPIQHSSMAQIHGQPIQHNPYAQIHGQPMQSSYAQIPATQAIYNIQPAYGTMQYGIGTPIQTLPYQPALASHLPVHAPVFVQGSIPTQNLAVGVQPPTLGHWTSPLGYQPIIGR